jgi:hypothetical protein
VSNTTYNYLILLLVSTFSSLSISVLPLIDFHIKYRLIAAYEMTYAMDLIAQSHGTTLFEIQLLVGTHP